MNQYPFYSTGKLYKYCTIDTALKIINSNSFYLNKIADLNDPFDCDFNILDYSSDYRTYAKSLKWFWKRSKVYEPYGFFAKVWEETGNNPESLSRIAPNLAMAVYRYMSGVTCFSERYNSPLMWAHYAKNDNGKSHAGVCLGFDVGLKPLSFDFLESLLMPEGVSSNSILLGGKVRYNNTPEKINFFEHEEEAIEHVVMNKAEDWGYEKEWRIYSTTYFGLVHFPKSSLNRIIFGLKISEYDQQRIIKAVLGKDYKKAKFSRIQPVVGQFKFETEKLEDQRVKEILETQNWSKE